MGERGVVMLTGQGGTAAEVKPIELFFDLVYVLAVTQLTRYLLDHFSLRGAGETLLLLLAVWSAWAHTAWITSRLDAGVHHVRLLLVALMLGSLLMSAFLPDAFGDRGAGFAAVYVAIQAGRTAFVFYALGRDHALAGHFRRMLLWFSASGLLWLAGGLAHGELRIVCWGVAAGLDLVAVGLGFPVPGLGHSRRSASLIAGVHLAHRCSLFIILALGESILVIGTNLEELPMSRETTAAFVVAFIASVTLWWIYFDHDEEAGLHAMDAAAEPGELGRWAYSYSHIPIVAGIIVVAAADELTIAHPLEGVTMATAALILGGPALYIAGVGLFEWSLWHTVPRSRLFGIGALAALVLVAVVSSTLVLSLAAMLVLIGVATWDGRRAGEHIDGVGEPFAMAQSSGLEGELGTESSNWL